MNKPDIHKIETRGLLVMLRAARARESLVAYFSGSQRQMDVDELAQLPPFNPTFTIDELKAELAAREHLPTKEERMRASKSKAIRTREKA